MKNKFTMWALAFVAGAIVGAAIVWIMCCCCCNKSCTHQKTGVIQQNGDSPGSGPTLVTKEKANTCFKAYLTSFVSVDTLKGFAINMRQFNAMQTIVNGNPGVLGFRIYMGMDSLTPVRFVVGFGSPDHVDTVFMTTDENSGPCPHICDTDSPVIQP